MGVRVVQKGQKHVTIVLGRSYNSSHACNLTKKMFYFFSFWSNLGSKPLCYNNDEKLLQQLLSSKIVRLLLENMCNILLLHLGQNCWGLYPKKSRFVDTC